MRIKKGGDNQVNKGDNQANKHVPTSKSKPAPPSKSVSPGKPAPPSKSVSPIRKKADLGKFYERAYRVIQQLNEDGYWTENDMHSILEFQQNHETHFIEEYLLAKNKDIELYLGDIEDLEKLEQEYNAKIQNPENKPKGDLKSKMEIMSRNFDEAMKIREEIVQKKVVALMKHFNLSNLSKKKLKELSKYDNKAEKFKFFYFVDNLYESAKIEFMKNLRADNPLDLSQYPVPEVQSKPQKRKNFKFSQENQTYLIQSRDELAKLELMPDEDEVVEPNRPKPRDKPTKPHGR